MSRRRKLLIAIAGSITLLILFTACVLPGIVRNKAVEGIATATGRRATIERIAINPFTLRARVDGFRLAEPDGRAVFASFSSLSVRVSTASLVRRALVVGDLTLTRPQVNLVRVADNRYNFSDIVDRIRKEPKSGGESHFSLNNIRITNGSLDFDDRAARLPARHTVRDLNLAIPFISNIPYLADRYVTPHFAALVNDSPLRLEGKLKPLAKSAETVLTLKLEKLDLPHYLAYLPFEPGFAMPGGRLSTDLELAYRIGAQEKPELNISGSVTLDGVGFTEKGGAPLLALKEAAARLNRWGVFGGEADLAQVKLDGLDLHLDRDRQGVWNFARLLPAEGRTTKTPPAKSSDKKEEDKRPPIKLALLSLTNSALHYRDAQVQPGFAANLNKIDFQFQDFATTAKQLAHWRFSCAGDGGEELAASGTAGAVPLTANAELKVAGVRLERYYPYLADQLTAPVRGVAGVSGKLSYSAETGLKLADANLTLSDLLVPFGASDRLSLKSVAVSNTSLDLKERQAVVGSVSLQRGRIALTREADGSLSFQKLLKKSPAPRSTRPAAAGSPVKPFRYTVRELGIKGVDAVFTDRGKEEAPTFTLTGISTTLRNITGPKFAPIPFALSAGFGDQGGKLAVSGSAVPDPFSLKGVVTLSKIPLRDFEDYFPEDLEVSIAGGTLDTKLTLDLAKKGERLVGSYGGSLGVRSFYALDTEESDDLLKWESLQIENVRGTLEPFSLAIKDIALTSPFARVIVNKDGTLNLQHLKKSPAAGEAAAAKSAPAPVAAVQPTTQAGPAPVTIDSVTIQDGTLAFLDHKLPGGFASTFYNLGGRVSGLSSEASRFATVDLRGALENRSPLKISGVINPLRGDLFADLTLAFTDIELSPVTPYSGTYLGYGIDKGKLFLDLKYRIDKKVLDAQNKVFIDQLTFGSKVESEQATNLPVRLAVALLKDSRGEIHLDLPVTGRTDDPKFSVWQVAFQMLRNLLVKAATSPFALISSLVGSGEDFSAVTFVPGSARLTAAEQDKLGKLAKVLKDRPAVSLEMAGYVDRQRDPEGYRQEQLERKVRSEKFRALVKSKQNRSEDSAETIAVSSDEYPLYLKLVYRNEDFPKPRNAIGLVKDLSEPEMKKLILAHIVVGDRELQQLASERAAVVQSYLKDRAALPLQRMFLKSGDPFKASEKKEQVASRVELGVVAK